MRAGEAKRPIPCAINKEIRYLGGFVRWASKLGHITPRRLQSDSLPYKRPLPSILSVDEVLKIIQASEPFYQAFLLCLYSLGLRFTEARNLTWDRVDMKNMSIKVKQKGGTFKILPLGERLKRALKAIKPKDGGTYVFISDRTGRPIVDIRKAIARACEKAKVARHVNPHLFRHSVASHLMSENQNASIIQKFLGHSQLATTQWYSHVSADNLRGAGKVISGFLK